MKYVYPATVTPEDDGRYSIWFDDLLGCATSGDNLADALDAASDALSGWLYGAEKNGDAIPAPSQIPGVSLEPGQFVTLVVADIEAYRRIVESFAVKKTLTIPSWLNERAEAAHINFSQVLQEGIRSRLGV